MLQHAGADTAPAVRALGDNDQAVFAQVAGLLQARGVSVQDTALREATRKPGPHVKRGFEVFFEAWRECQLARGQRR